MPDDSRRRRRYAIVGAGARAETSARAIAVDHATATDHATVADHATAAHRAAAAAAAAHRAAALDRESVDVAVVTIVDRRTRTGPGGADARPLATRLGPGLPGDAGAGTTGPTGDELGRSATERDGAGALPVGLTADEPLATGRAVRVADLLGLSRYPLSAPRTASVSTERTSTAPRDRKEQSQ